MKKRALSLLMAFVMVLSLLPATARAADVQEITDAAGLADIASDPSGSYVLKNDIGSESKPVTAAIAGTFTGTFDGAGHTVWLDIQSGNNVGLFSKVGEGGTVKNVVTAGSVTGNNYVGGIAGVCEGTIRNCGNTAAVTGSKCVGGIAGQTTNGTTGRWIENCCNSGAVTATNKKPIGVGGLVGSSNALTLSNSCNSGTVTAGKADNKAGGLIGFSGSADKVTVSNSWWKKDCVTQKSGTVDRSFNGQLTESNNASYTDLQTAVDALNANCGDNAEWAEWADKEGVPVLKFGASAPAATISGGDKLWMVNSDDQPYETFAVKLDGADDTGAAVTWSAAPEGVVTLADGRDEFHKIVTACKPGKVKLTATVTAADDKGYPAVKEITVMPFINTIKIEGTPAVGKTVYARAYVFTGGTYEQTYDQIEGLPGLTYTWKKQTENNDYVEITGVTGDTLTITEELLGRSLWLSTRYNGEDKSSNTAFGPIVSAAAGDLKEDASWLFDRMQPYTGAEQKADAVLPLAGTAAPHGSAITWTSSDETILDPATGKLTLPETGEKPTVTLTAVLKNGGETLKREYTITVWSKKDLADYDANLTQQLADDVNAKLGERDVLVPVYGTDTNVLTMVKNKLGCGDIAVSITKVVRNGAEDEASGIAANGDISYFYADPNQTADERLQWFGSYTVTFSFVRGDAAVTREVPVTVYWDVEKVERVMRDEILSQVDIDTSEPVTEDFELPRIADGKKWTLISWESSDPSITVSKRNQDSADTLFDPYVAVVRGGLTEKEVTLTAVFTFQRTNDVTGNEEPIRLYKTFTVKVAPSEDMQKYQSALDAVFGEGSLTDAASGEPLTAANGVFTVRNDIQFPTTRDLGAYMKEQFGKGFDGKYTPVVITSSAPAVIAEPDVANAARVAVYRPAVGEKAKTVTLTVKILDRPSGEGRDYAKMPVLAEKRFTVTVQPLTEAEITNELALMAEVKAHYWDGIKNGNTAARDVTGDLAPFVEVYKQDGALVWVRDVREMRNSGIVPVAMDGWQELEAWRLFRSSNPAAVTHENLLVTQQFEGKAVTVTSALSSETLGRYGELYRKNPGKYAAYEELADLYYQTVSAELVVRGRNTAHMVKKMIPVNGGTETRLVSEAVEEKATVSFTLSGNGELWLGTRTLRDLDEGVTVFDVLRQLRDEGVLSFEHKGGYVQSITCGGKTLAELDEGKNSGWLYTVNGELPDVYMSAYGLKNGDSVRVYFTKDYTKEPGADRWKPVTPVTKTETVTNADGSTTKTETKPDGTVIETTTWRDGSTLTAETSPNGRVETVEKRADGTTVETVESASGGITASVSVPKSVGSTRVDIPVSKPTGSMVAVIVHPDGTEEIVRGSVVTETGIALRAEGDVRLKIIDNAKRFNDMADHWAKDAVEFASSRELFDGVGNDAFGPDLSMTRGMVSTVLARLAGADTAGGETWYAKGTVWAVENGISDGTAPEQPVTREQLAAMLYRYAGSPAVSGELSFDDTTVISIWAYDAVRWCVDNGILNGVGGNRMAPQDLARRGQVAAMLMRFLQATV